MLLVPDYFDQEKYDEARDAFQKALDEDPEFDLAKEALVLTPSSAMLLMTASQMILTLSSSGASSTAFGSASADATVDDGGGGGPVPEPRLEPTGPDAAFETGPEPGEEEGEVADTFGLGEEEIDKNMYNELRHTILENKCLFKMRKRTKRLKGEMMDAVDKMNDKNNK